MLTSIDFFALKGPQLAACAAHDSPENPDLRHSWMLPSPPRPTQPHFCRGVRGKWGYADPDDILDAHIRQLLPPLRSPG